MAYDEDLAHRLRGVLGTTDGVTERRMFGGLAFLVHRHMAVCAASDGGLMVRVDPADAEGLLAPPGVARMVMGGRELDGWLLVGREVLDDDAALRSWVDRGVAFVRTLPPK